MIGKHKTKAAAAGEYHEVPVKPAVYTMLIVVALVAAPLGWLNLKIGAEGSKGADISRYSDLVAVVNRDVNTVQRILDHEQMDEKILKGSLAKVPQWISPDDKDLPVNRNNSPKQNSGNLKIELSGIYWSPTDPIATIDDENYHVGDQIQNHKIIEIRKNAVVFEDPMGETIVVEL